MLPASASQRLSSELQGPPDARGALFEIADPAHVIVSALRHQLEDDYH
jgi:hypothetical protein